MRAQDLLSPWSPHGYHVTILTRVNTKCCTTFVSGRSEGVNLTRVENEQNAPNIRKINWHLTFVCSGLSGRQMMQTIVKCPHILHWLHFVTNFVLNPCNRCLYTGHGTFRTSEQWGDEENIETRIHFLVKWNIE